MAKYKFEVDGVATIDDTQVQSNSSIQNIRIICDTKDNDNYERATSVIVLIEVTIRIEEATKDDCRNLMDWALTVSGDDVYKTVNITIKDTNDEIRNISIPDVFCKNYQEHYFLNANGNETNCLKLNMIQHRGKTSEITNT